MRKLVLSAVALLLAVPLLGCGAFYSVFSTPAPSPSPLPTPVPTNPAQKLPLLSGEWQIRFTQTGGIAGVFRNMEISSSGEVKISDRTTHPGEEVVTHLTAEKLVTLSDLVAASSFRPASMPTGCADCFIFDLQITGSDGNFQVQLDQVELPDSGLQPLVDFLAELLNNTGK
jgi:hypothetical protein